MDARAAIMRSYFVKSRKMTRRNQLSCGGFFTLGVMKKFLGILIGLGLVFTTVSPSFGQSGGSGKKHGKKRGGGHKGSGTRNGPAK